MYFQEGITCLDFHFNGAAFVLGTVTGVWMIYNVSTRDQVFLCDESKQPISTARFSPDGKLLAVASKVVFIK